MFTFLFFILMPIYIYIFYQFVFQSYISLPFLIIFSPVLSFLTIALLVIIIAPISRLFSHKNKFKNYIFRQIAKFVIFFMNIDLKVEGRENIPKETCVVYANHKADVDVLFLYAAMKKPIGFVSKPGVYKVPILKTYMNSIGCICMHRDCDREGAKDMIRAIKLVKDNHTMGIFPEGGIKSQETEKMVYIRAGAYKLATKPQVPILPLSIIGSSKVSKNSPFKRTHVKLVFHEPIYKEDYNDLNTHEIGDKVFSIVNSCLK